MKEPDKIYVSIGYEAQTKPFHHSIEYIRKDALLGKLNEVKLNMGTFPPTQFFLGEMQGIIDAIEIIKSI